MIEPERIRNLNLGQPAATPAYVLYWMQAAQRTEDNPALWFATSEADRLGLPLLVLFVLGDFPDAGVAHFHWMLEGLEITATRLQDAGIAFSIQRGDPAVLVARAAVKAAMVICDASPHRWARSARVRLTAEITVPVVEVDGESIVPLRIASSKQEWAARTIRPRISAALGIYLEGPILALRVPRISARQLDVSGDDELFRFFDKSGGSGDKAGKSRKTVIQVAGQDYPPSGSLAAESRLKAFMENSLDSYDKARNDPNLPGTSGLSPYLHFGQLSAVAVARQAREHGGPSLPAFLEQLAVRRELCRNFSYYRPDDYDAWSAIPAWAAKTLLERANDTRDYLYTLEDFEAANTHDAYWNAAQHQLLRTGTIHNYMRMYWGKMILAWSRTPQEAFETAQGLNDRLALDGRDPNGWAGVAWCFGLHDRPWPQRAVFGTVRSMSAAGLKRKFDADAYARTWNRHQPDKQ
ncbi:MAG: deoxyribodipyrimidine photo-lyase [Spirochaetia bacterium]|jgi:deoxyribodipyrimidine photo-lyase|nr:deoxyribodipyrimidine photo-lyase [Spirochaetia bacterium]